MGFINITILDLIDIFVVALLIFKIYKITRGTNAISIVAGILIIYLIWITVRLLHMELLSMLLGQIIGVGVIALIIVFQQEIRRFLLILGSRYFSGQDKFFGRLLSRGRPEATPSSNVWVESVVSACKSMAATKTGALIVIAENIDMTTIINTGKIVDALVSDTLLQNIFFKNAPLHDGAIILTKGRIAAAGCILPSTESEVPESFGTRHRAALGTVENYDVVVVAVSEEKGSISVAMAGKLKVNVSARQLREVLLKINR
ncbi:MAG: diadenylate cyclase CdaA [Rikenellaceae bacterium]